MIAIIDYGVGNLRSVAKAFEYIGHQAVVTSDPNEVLEADKVVLPGVGAFGKSIESLTKAGMVPVVKEVVTSGRPLLGICLGLQMLFTESTELFGDATAAIKGLDILPGRVLRFPESHLKVPQIGWNSITKKNDSPLLHGVAQGSFVYFVHSYYVVPENQEVIACTTNYGLDYCSGISYGNLFAFQFHPEKSSQVGLKILDNFAKLK
ncbi:MAG TPA: imidazole glycerol phosphate synthase subunit HisH [Bacillota bacterium]|jgi:glutamine amidotransferase|nr:imidazole glycerol phosphate synthase subunit HisH [Bacillota bacterium]HOL08786.1 imidazole glycerol phosphate synthase subunit HisH [Bacillota bacterium]HPO96876.1 imidazole glycerol phosphate synthase subunit HisH [Bacillota bacterium]